MNLSCGWVTYRLAAPSSSAPRARARRALIRIARPSTRADLSSPRGARARALRAALFAMRARRSDRGASTAIADACIAVVEDELEVIDPTVQIVAVNGS